jgi:hypothetical protein
MKKFMAALLVISGAYLIFDNEKKNGTIKSWINNLFGIKSAGSVERTDFVQRTKFPLRSGSQEIPEVGYLQKVLGLKLTGTMGVKYEIPEMQKRWDVSEITEEVYNEKVKPSEGQYKSEVEEFYKTFTPTERPS